MLVAPSWLLSELDPYYDIAFGLCDLGMDLPELRNVSIANWKSPAPNAEYPICRMGQALRPSYPMSVYHKAARMNKQITTDQESWQLRTFLD
ncbi:DUF2958 domain-containing protein [Dyadobacter psychrophilus]|uniref:Uncharacterized protein n=1 Tax=Dyadobacter psychrophilus TaxID=651661 RepID=A0A1T5HG26_9BACT|nr:DUF2958 domain-containing protein [Dyadobacter psychrophilus]SKC19612.1 Protein of unknown function [Dyadobacter psychrophilus]